ncbi:MAG: hypothetical protein E7549_01120 [Ruminococcaceae bacterium]|nr:hypothetical protein [Oscillospiraceae bacterium]
MQENFIKAFRQRLLRAGFTDVSISGYCGLYYVYCVSPSGEKICRVMDKEEIVNTPKTVWFD